MRVLTAGYGNRGYDAFLALLRQYQVTHLVDVRSIPQSSYWEDFRRERLALLMSQTEIRYVYMGDTLGGDLGTPALWKDPGSPDLEALRLEPRLEKGINKLLDAARDPAKQILLMCGCLRPNNCHRSRLLGPALVAKGVDYQHIDAAGQLKSQAQIDSETSPQSSLFSV